MNLDRSPLLTDLYQLTMLNAYFAHGMRETAVFELFVRTLPPNRNFMIAAGLDQALDFLESLRFAPDELEWIDGYGLFGNGFVQELERMRFTGDVHAMPEGTIFFPEEPVLRVTAPLPEAQLVESRLINLLNFQSLVATKAARCVLVAPGKTLVDFGFRRAHGAEAGILAARASYIAGFSGTATVAAGRALGIPLFGTMAHSFVQAHDDESDAFLRFARTYPRGTTVLIDTYDTEAAAKKIVALAARSGDDGASIKGVRLDSGDLSALARSVRTILNAGGLQRISIFASGNLDEYVIRDLVAAEVPIDGFGIGTSLVTSADAPSLDAVYKLQEYAGKPRHKRSTGKRTLPGRKQVYRHYEETGRFGYDTLALVDEAVPDAEPLLIPVMKNGRRSAAAESLGTLRERARSQLAHLPLALRSLDAAAAPYPIRLGGALAKLSNRDRLVGHNDCEASLLCDDTG